MLDSHLLECLLGGLGGGSLDLCRGDGADDADGHTLAHVPHGEAAESGELGEGLHAHGLSGHQADKARVAVLQGLGLLLKGLA